MPRDMDYNRRPPKTLHELCKERLVTEYLATMGNLQMAPPLSWLGWPFTCMESKTFRRHGIRKLQAVMSQVPNHFNEIALEMYKRDPTCIEAILHPLLLALEINSQSLKLALDYSYNLTNLTTLYLFFDITRHPVHVQKFYEFVGGLVHLTHLKLSNCCTDALLAVVGANCKQLCVLDAEEDSEMTITDHGLAFLVNCGKLHTVVLNDAGDEYDYEDRYFGITGKGIANLMISLPNLHLLICEPYLLREALRFVHMINVNSHTYQLKYLHCKFPDREFLYSVNRLCPMINELVIEDQSRDCVEVLPNFRHLHTLKLENCSWTAREEPCYKMVFSNLIKLELKNPKTLIIDQHFILKLGKWCPNLTKLSITLYQPDVLTKPMALGSNAEFFPKLESLAIDGDVSLHLIETLLISSTLKSLTIYIHDLSVSSGQFDNLMLKMARNGHLSQVETLQCFQWKVSLETMLFVIDSCVNLRNIWGLDLLMMCPVSIRTIQEHIARNNRWIDLHDVSFFEKSRGISFLSEKSKRRVQAAEQMGDRDMLEHLLGEQTLDDLLKEVNLL